MTYGLRVARWPCTERTQKGELFEMPVSALSYDRLRAEVAGTTSAIRRITVLKPAGGDGDKVFPPTYQDGPYATEERLVLASDGAVRTVRTVLLDSVQSQANRMELALLRGYREGRLKFPMVVVDFSEDSEPWINEIGQITVLEAPHRIADAILRDSTYKNKPFRKSLGQCLDQVRATHATPLYQLSPTSLIFGVWDSTGPKGGLGAKFQRLLVSEIVGFEAVPGVRPAGRIDPLQIENIQGIGAPMYRAPDNDWTFDEAEAVRHEKKGNLIRLKPSEINHGNIPPALKNDKGVPHHGGMTIAHAIQTTVFSLAGLRRLSFPLNGRAQSETDLAGRTVLAAMALVAVCLQDEEGYDLRSRCLLDGDPGPFELVARGKAEPFSLDAAGAVQLFEQAVAEAERHGLKWSMEPYILKPSDKLRKLILESRKKTMAVAED